MTGTGTWEIWEDELTFDRLVALRKSVDACPPVYMSAYNIALSLGAVEKPSEAPAQSDRAMGPETFLMLFGGSSGEFGPTGTVH